MADELVLLERVFLRVAAAETDEKLEQVLGRFLAPVLLKLASPIEDVKKKVMEVLAHVNKRVKSRPQIQLPVEQLIQQYEVPDCSPFVSNFNIVYLKMGYKRLSQDKQVELAPRLVGCIDKKPSQQQDSILQLTCPVLGHIAQISSDKLQSLFMFDERPRVKQAILSFCLDLLLMPYNLSPQTSRPMSAPSGGEGREENNAPPGLSLAALNRVAGDTVLNPVELEKTKLALVTFLSSDLFQEAEVVVHFLVASADPRYSVSDAGVSQFKKTSSCLDWNDSHMGGVIQSIYDLYLGTTSYKLAQRPQSAAGAKSAPTDQRAPAGVRLRIQLLSILLQSSLSPDMFPFCVQVMFKTLFGDVTNQKLRFLAAQFFVHIIQHCSDSKIEVMAPLLLSAVNKLLDEPEQETKLRCLTYVALGQLAKRRSSLFNSNGALVQKLFESLVQEQGDVRLAIHEALMTLATAFKGVEGLVAVQLEALLLKQIEKPEDSLPQARLAALSYAGTVFSQSHAPSRYLCLLASADHVDNVRDESQRILNLHGESLSVQTPLFPEMVQCISSNVDRRMANNLNYTVGASSLPFHPSVYKQILSYTRACLHCSAGVTVEDELSKTVTRKLNQYTACLRAATLLQSATQIKPTESDSVMKYYMLIRAALSQIAGADLHVVALKCLFELVSVSVTLMATVADQTGWLKQTFVESSHDETREAAAKLVGCVAGKLDNTRLFDLVSQTTKALNSKSFETQHGAVVLLGRLLPSCVSSITQRLRLDVYKETFMSLASVLNADHPKLIAAACKAIGLIGLQCVLPLEDGQKEDNSDESSDSPKKRLKTKSCTTKLDIVEMLGRHLCQHAVLKVKEKAATALGLLPIGDKQFPHTKTVLKNLFDSTKNKQVDMQFVVADAIACASSLSASHIVDVPVLEQDLSDMSKTELSQDMMTWSLNEIASHYVNHSVSHIRQAACVWLLAIVRTAGEHPVVKGRLQELQSLLLNYLTDRDEFTQEVASRALGLVYERGSSEDKEELVSRLVDTLMSGRRSLQPVSGDTRIFEERELGKAPEGSGLSTYKELCSLASDLNQPDLIYKFMRLANHNAMWSSKKGAAFGFSTIAAQAKEQLAPYLPLLVPRLFRYRYDPNPSVQQAMNSIWTAVVPESQKEVERYFSAILEDILTNLASNMWRIRQSCCLALSDLLQGRQIPVDECIEQLPRIWELVLRARDDIKESVRKAADVACKRVSKLSIKLCDVSCGKSGQSAVAVLLPCLMDRLVTSKVSEIRAISLVTLLEISKNAGPQLKPHIPTMVVALLETLTSLEPQVLNYVSLHVGSDSEGQEKLDSIRVSASKSSPMMETVDLCMRHVDEDVLPELCARLADLTRSAIGIATKVGCCQVIVSLCHQCTRDLTPHAGKLLSALLSCFNDRSPGVRKAAATSVGHLVKYAKDSSVEKLIGRVKTWYLEKDDSNVRLACGLVFRSFAQHSLDTLKKFACNALPVVFLGMHQRNEDEDTDVWSEVWSEATPGTEGGLRLYLDEIMSFVCPLLQSQSWQTKAQAARAMETAAEKLGRKLNKVQRENMLNALLQSLPGRTWDGKERLLLAVSQLCQPSKDEPLSADTLDKAVRALLVECNKQKKEYKLVAIESVASVLDSNDLNMFPEFSRLCFPLIDPDNKDDLDTDERPEERAAAREMTLKLVESTFRCLAKVWPKDKETQVQYDRPMFDILVKSLARSTWKIQVAVLDCLCVYLERLCGTAAHRERCKEISVQLMPLITTCLGNVKYAAIRGAAVKVLEAFLPHLMGDVEYSGLCLTGTHWKRLLTSMEEMARSESQVALKQRISKLLADAIRYQ